MIESVYWKEELSRIARTLRPVKRPPRWSERLVCTTERDIMIGFFIIRRMIELHKVSRQTSDLRVQVFSIRALKKINKLSQISSDNYEWPEETNAEEPLGYIANQFIHAYLSRVERNSQRNWSDIMVVSDFDRNDRIWRVPISEVIRIFEIASSDYPASLAYEWNEVKYDYSVVTE